MWVELLLNLKGVKEIIITIWNVVSEKSDVQMRAILGFGKDYTIDNHAAKNMEIECGIGQITVKIYESDVKKKEIQGGNKMDGKRLYRSKKSRMICGVCGGIANYFNIDPTLVRLAFVLIAMGAGSGILAYIIAAIIIPDED